MTYYRYKAVDAQGKLVPGELEANDLQELQRQLSNMTLDLVSYRQVKQKTGVKIKRKDLVAFCLYMEQLTRAGVPIMQGLAELKSGVFNPVLQGIVAAVMLDIEGGKTLSQALAKHPAAFDKVFIALVAAGESTGQLAEVFKDLTESLKWQDEIIARGKKAVLYPAFVLSVTVAVVVFVMIYLVPQLVEFIGQLGHSIPWHTRVLMVVSAAFADYWPIIFGLPVLLAAAYRYYRKVSPAFLQSSDRLILRLWIIGPLLEKIALARFASYFALTYRAGLDILECIRICEAVVNNAWLQNGLAQARRTLADGAGISDAFERTGLFPLLILRMLKVGETSGALDQSLLNISYFYERDVKESISRMQVMIEPLLTVVLGLILGWVMLSVIGPIYHSVSGIGAAHGY